MKRATQWTPGLAALALAAVGLSACSSGVGIQPQSQVRVFKNGHIVTMDANRTVATALAIRGNTIIAVGSDADMDQFPALSTEVTDLQGQTVLPGFIDAHTHLVLGAGRLGQCSMDGVALTASEIVAAVVGPPPQDGCDVSQGAAGEWFQIVNVNPAGLVATKADLDQISTTRPILMSGIDGHTGWVNTLGLATAGIDCNTPDPVGGEITRAGPPPANCTYGEPTGALKDAAQDLVTAVIPPPTMAETMAKTRIALDLARSKGVTTVQDAVATAEVMAVYEALEQDGSLKMRVRGDLHPGDNAIVDSNVIYGWFNDTRAHFANSQYIRADGVKIFSDGVIEYPTQTAAMIKPYLDIDGNVTTNYGGRYFDQATLEAYVARLDQDGFRVNVHSIGDFTTHAVLDAFQHARDVNGVTDNRHQISHVQIVDPADVPRFAELGVFPNMQMFWALPDVYSVDALQPFIDPGEYSYMYAAGSLTSAGATLIGGSDWPVDMFPGDPMPNTPLRATFMGVTRTNPVPGDPLYGEVLLPNEVVERDTMLAAYTINAAKGLKMEDQVGSIEVGKLADLAFFDVDVTSVDINELIWSVDVAATMFDGEFVYQRPAPVASKVAAAPVRAAAALSRSHAACSLGGTHKDVDFHAKVTAHLPGGR
jgi:predicted amidohydrolase YtcJ